MGIPITSSAHPKANWPGVKKWFNIGYQEIPEKWPLCFETETSDKKYEEFVLSTGFGMAPVKPEGIGVTYDYESQGYLVRMTHFVVGLGFIVTLEEIEDNLYPELGKTRGQRLGFSMRQSKEFWGAYQYNYAFDSTTQPGGDAAAYISASHPTLAGNQSNYPDTAADFSETVLEDIAINMMLAQNYRGMRINLMPRKLLIPPQLSFEAGRVLKSVLQAGTANNDLNVLRAEGTFPEGYTVNPYFTDSNAFFALARVPAGTGMLHMERRKMDLTQDSDFDTDDAKHKATARYVFGMVDWRVLWGSPGSS